MQENAALHNPYSQELLEQDAIRSGDLEALYRSTQIAYVGKVGTVAHDPLRQAKNIMIVVTTLASRSAMEGGLLPEIAYSMSDAFIQRAEEYHTEAEVYALAVQVEIEFCKAVQALSHVRRRNPIIVRCKELILQHLHSRISVKDLAQQLDVHPDYLSKLFLREEGIKLTDYILNEKIRGAKERLAYTRDSIDAVSSTFGFTSQSHFGKVFREKTGMTPGEFRDSYGQELPVGND